MVIRPEKKRKAIQKYEAIKEELLLDIRDETNIDIKINYLHSKSYDKFENISQKYKVSYVEVEDINLEIAKELMGKKRQTFN